MNASHEIRFHARREAVRICAGLPRYLHTRTVERALLEGLAHVRSYEARSLLAEPVAAFRKAHGLEPQPSEAA